MRRNNRRRKPAGGAQEERIQRPIMSSRGSYEDNHHEDEHDATSEDDDEPNKANNSTITVQSRRLRIVAIVSLFLLLYGLLLRGVYSRYGPSLEAADGGEGVCTSDAMRDRPNKEEEADGTARKENKLVQMIREATNPHPLKLYHYPSSSSSRIETPQAQQHPLQSTATTTAIPKKKKKEYRNIRYPLAHTTSPQLDREQLSQIAKFRDRVLAHVPHLHERAAQVPWGGDARIPWWMPVLHHHHRYHSSTDSDQSLDAMEGGRLLWYYYKIMSRYITDPGNLSAQIYFPFRLCKQHGCAAEDTIRHTLQWRERYQPWRVTPQMVRENSNGFCYQRGFSPPAVVVAQPQQQQQHHRHHHHHSHNYGRHAMVWFRLGRHRVDDGLMYFRVVLHSIDQAVASALRESNLRVGKFNVLVDGTDFEFRKVPDMAHCTCVDHSVYGVDGMDCLFCVCVLFWWLQSRMHRHSS